MDEEGKKKKGVLQRNAYCRALAGMIDKIHYDASSKQALR